MGLQSSVDPFYLSKLVYSFHFGLDQDIDVFRGYQFKVISDFVPLKKIYQIDNNPDKIEKVSKEVELSNCKDPHLMKVRW